MRVILWNISYKCNYFQIYLCTFFLTLMTLLVMGRLDHFSDFFHLISFIKLLFMFFRLFKAAVRNFCLFVVISVWKPGIAVSCGIIFRAWGCDPVFRHGSSADESIVLRWTCSCQSLHRCGYLLYFAITDSSLCLGIYDPNKNFHHILPSEKVSNKSALFVLPNWGKKHYNKLRYQWWFI